MSNSSLSTILEPISKVTVSPTFKEALFFKIKLELINNSWSLVGKEPSMIFKLFNNSLLPSVI